MSLKKNIIFAVSALAIYSSLPTYAGNDQKQQATFEKTETADNSQYKELSFNSNEYRSISNIIGQAVYNPKGERIAKISDLILDKNGEIIMIILADGDFTGLGKHVAFDDNILLNYNNDGNIVVDVTEEIIDRVASFSYDREDYSENIMVMPSNGFSAEQLIQSDVVNKEYQSLAKIEDIIFKENAPTRLIVKFDELLGFGGESVVLDFAEYEIINSDDGLNFSMTEMQAHNFETYKQSQR